MATTGHARRCMLGAWKLFQRSSPKWPHAILRSFKPQYTNTPEWQLQENFCSTLGSPGYSKPQLSLRKEESRFIFHRRSHKGQLTERVHSPQLSLASGTQPEPAVTSGLRQHMGSPRVLCDSNALLRM